MDGIGIFFEKYKKLLRGDAALKQAISDAIFSCVGARIEPKSITMRKGVALVPATPVLRTELMLKRASIIEELRRSDPRCPVSDIR